jgi:membrane protein YdbS with pleckstrin-like domain
MSEVVIEEVLWEASPSQVINIVSFIVWSWTIVIPLWKYLVTKNTKYQLTTQRLIIYSGVLNKTTNECELFRVKDITEYNPLFLRFFLLGNLTLKTSDLSHPVINIFAVSDTSHLRDTIRNLVQSLRNKNRVREFDDYSEH